jgi:hypothetical protein
MQDDPLVEPLKHAAERTRPEFDEALHARVMRRLNAAAPSSGAAGTRRLSRLSRLATAAALALVCGLAWHLLRERPNPVSPGGPRTLPLVGDLLTGSSAEPVRQELRRQVDESRLAYLDRDAQHFASFVLQQVSAGIPPPPAQKQP